MKLSDLAVVRTGLILSRKQANGHTDYCYPLLNLRCLGKEGVINLDEADVYKAKEPLRKEYLTQKRDVVVRLSTPYTAVLIDESTDGMAISSNFAVIRIEDERLEPGFLCWLLNTPKVKRTIYKYATSNVLGVVRSSFLADFKLNLPSVENQNKIARLYKSTTKEIRLLKALTREKEKLCFGKLERFYEKTKWEKNDD